MAEKYVIFNGVEMVAEWPAKIEESQRKTAYVIFGKECVRIRYGDEIDDWGANRGPCHDCGVIKGQYHVAFLCDVERCPLCDEQAISCDCIYESND